MKYLVSMIALAAGLGFAGHAMAFDAKAGIGLGAVQSSTNGGAQSGGGVAGLGVIAGVSGIQSTQTAASTGNAGAQFMVTPQGITTLTQQSAAAASQQTLTMQQLGLNAVVGGGTSNAGTWNNANASGVGIQGYLKF